MAAFTLSLDPRSVPRFFSPSSPSPSPSPSPLVHQPPHFRFPCERPKSAAISFSSSLQGAPAYFPVQKGRSSSLLRTAAVRHLEGSLTKTAGLRFAVVVARFNEIVTKLLLEGALNTFTKYSVREEDIDVVWVPGSFEIGVVAQKLAKSKDYHAVLCIGAVIRGDTSHYDAVANSAASGVLSAGLNSGVPCIFGVLTCDDMDQALNRAGGKAGNKGSEAALTAFWEASEKPSYHGFFCASTFPSDCYGIVSCISKLPFCMSCLCEKRAMRKD